MRKFTTITAAAVLVALVSGPAGAQQSPSDDGTSANGPITIFKNMQAEPDGMRVAIDGHEVDHLKSATYDDITSVVHPGKNTLTLRWNQPVERFNFTVAYAATRNNFRNVLVVHDEATRDPSLRQSGSRTLTFTIPG